MMASLLLAQISSPEECLSRMLFLPLRMMKTGDFQVGLGGLQGEKIEILLS